MVSLKDGSYMQKEDMVMVHGVFMFNQEMTPTQNHQCFEELLHLQKEFSAMVYYQKDLERCLK